jgi:hypothetical protein
MYQSSLFHSFTPSFCQVVLDTFDADDAALLGAGVLRGDAAAGGAMLDFRSNSTADAIQVTPAQTPAALQKRRGIGIGYEAGLRESERESVPPTLGVRIVAVRPR